MISIKVNGVEYPLSFTLSAMDAIEEVTGKTVGDLGLRISSKADRSELLEVLAVLMREGAAEGVETPSAKALHGMMTPGALLASLKNVSDALSEGMRMESDEPEEGAEVDVVLEEIKKKEPRDESPIEQ
jgi:hypothetical protein